MYRPCYTRKMTKEEYEAFHEGWLKRRAMDAKRRAARRNGPGRIWLTNRAFPWTRCGTLLSIG